MLKKKKKRRVCGEVYETGTARLHELQKLSNSVSLLGQDTTVRMSFSAQDPNLVGQGKWILIKEKVQIQWQGQPGDLRKQRPCFEGYTQGAAKGAI